MLGKQDACYIVDRSYAALNLGQYGGLLINYTFLNVVIGIPKA